MRPPAAPPASAASLRSSCLAGRDASGPRPINKKPGRAGLETQLLVKFAVGLDEPPTPSAYLRDRFAAFFVDRFAVLFFAVDRFAVFLLDFFVAALAIAVVLSVPLLRARESLSRSR